MGFFGIFWRPVYGDDAPKTGAKLNILDFIVKLQGVKIGSLGENFNPKDAVLLSRAESCKL